MTKLARTGGHSLVDYLTMVDERYATSIERRRPEEVLNELTGLPIAVSFGNGSHSPSPASD